MPYKCKGKCDNEKSSNGGRNAFTDGRKMCSVCMKYIKTDELHCYCCGVKMRIKATRSKSRAKRLENVVRY
jgi:rRNA maturation endonuclease Nob1